MKKKDSQPNPEVVKLIAISKESNQYALAEKLGTSQSRISEYKNGYKAITVQTLKSWCEILQIDIKKLF